MQLSALAGAKAHILSSWLEGIATMGTGSHAVRLAALSLHFDASSGGLTQSEAFKLDSSMADASLGLGKTSAFYSVRLRSTEIRHTKAAGPPSYLGPSPSR